jgi:hypothetical protein
MKKSLFLLLSIPLLAAGCNQSQLVGQPDPVKQKQDTNGYIQINKKPEAKMDTSKWKTYSDKNISFKYPEGWRVNIDKNDQATVFLLTDSKKEYLYEDSPLKPIRISYRLDKFGGSIDRTLSGNNMMKAILKKETMLIGGQQAYILYGVTPPVFHNERIVFTNKLEFYFTSNGNNLVAGYGKKTQQQVDDIFETILSTVNFP